MSSNYPNIHDAYGGFGEKPQTSKIELNPITNHQTASKIVPIYTEQQKNSLPSDASHADYPCKVCCPKCRNVGITRLQSQLGAAAWLWCVLLAPFGGAGFICLCLQSCRDKIHYCTRCGHIVGKKPAKVC